MKLNSIQFLRAVAAILVVYEHSMQIQTGFTVSHQQKFIHLMHFGCIGVDLFFVISGFIITYVASPYLGLKQGRLFLIKRFARINPVYYIVSLLFLAVSLGKMWFRDIDISDNIFGLIDRFMDTLFIIPLSGEPSLFSPLLIIGWTLSFEWLFYIFFFFLIIFNVKSKPFFLISLITLTIALGQIFKPQDFRLIFLTNPIMLEFLFGVFICWIYLKIKIVTAFAGAGILFVGISAYVYLALHGFGEFYTHMAVLEGKFSLSRFLWWGIPSGFIVAGCVFLEKANCLNRLWSNSWLRLTGDASYSIYLFHVIILAIFKMLFAKTGAFLPADSIIWIQLVIAVALSIGFYLIVEKPLIHAARKKMLTPADVMLTNKKVIYE